MMTLGQRETPTERRPRVYIAGPMTGCVGWNFRAFYTAEQLVAAAGGEPLNPARNYGGRTDLPRAQYLRRDIETLLTADAVLLLPGWRRSPGARLEHRLAEALALPMLDLHDLHEQREQLGAELWDALQPRWAQGAQDEEASILREAEQLVYGDRNQAYGHPYEDFTRTGRLWGAILGIGDIPPEKVGLCLAAVKTSRAVHALDQGERIARDTLVDGAGYWATVARVQERREQLEGAS